MKKQPRLVLRKIKLADVSPSQLEQVGGGIQPQTRPTAQTQCGGFHCQTDNTVRCQ